MPWLGLSLVIYDLYSHPSIIYLSAYLSVLLNLNSYSQFLRIKGTAEHFQDVLMPVSNIC